MNGTVAAICICPVAGGAMQQVDKVKAIAGCGLEGDRYGSGQGSFNKREGRGVRQVTLINGQFFPGSGFAFTDSRRNIVTEDVELMELIGREFQIGTAWFRGVEYCAPCMRPSKLAGKQLSFKKAFFDRGGLIAEVVEGGLIRVGDAVTPPPKGY